MISSDKATSKENRTTDMPETGAKEKSTEALEDAAAKKAAQLEVEARAIEEATTTADAAYVPTPSLLSSPSAAMNTDPDDPNPSHPPSTGTIHMNQK